MANNRSQHDDASNCAEKNSRGFTLIEMALSMSLFGIVLVSLGTMLALTMQAAPKPSDAATLIRDASYPASFMAEELAAATAVVSVSPTEIVFRTADRDGDDLPETITYSWSNKPGMPLNRAVNAGKPVPLIESVESLSFSAETQTHTLTTSYADGGGSFEHELSADKGLVSNIVAVLNSRLITLRRDEGYFQTLSTDAVPADALYWIPVEAEVLIAENTSRRGEDGDEDEGEDEDGGSGLVRLEIRISEGLMPTPVAVASRVVRTADLGKENWVRIEIPGTLKLAPDTKLGVMVVSLSGDRTVSVRAFNQVVFPTDPAARFTSNGGDSWSVSGTNRLGYRIKGKYFGLDKEDTTVETTVSTVRFSLNPSTTSATAISTTVDLPSPVRYGP